MSSTDQGLREFLAGQADVAADGNLLRLDERRVRATDLVDEIGIDFIGDAAADVVGLEC
jgi:hypothetical protein